MLIVTGSSLLYLKNKKLIYSDNHFLISPFNFMHALGGPCGDIHLGHFKKNKNLIGGNSFC